MNDFKEEWRAFLSKVKKTVVFDTETSGIDCNHNVILSISWQVLDQDMEKVYEKTHYFDWPDDESMVTARAIEVNGLTKERLAELGTSDKVVGLQEFADAVNDADMLVAHNGSFDKKFVLAEARREGVSIDMNMPMWDTMQRMTGFCAIPGYYGDYKWPKLIELANALRIKTDDIDWHQSAADVEVTVRCFKKIAEHGIVRP